MGWMKTDMFERNTIPPAPQAAFGSKLGPGIPYNAQDSHDGPGEREAGSPRTPNTSNSAEKI